VAQIETELEQQLGAEQYAELRELLTKLNACDIAGGSSVVANLDEAQA
jgi:hypothetical protein